MVFEFDFFPVFVRLFGYLLILRYDLLLIGESRGSMNFVAAIRKKNYLQLRPKHQIWAFIASEPSARHDLYEVYAEKELRNCLNWTVFASPEATVNRPYFYVRSATEESRHEQEQVVSSLRSRSKDVCWIFSNCDTNQSGSKLSHKKWREVFLFSKIQKKVASILKLISPNISIFHFFFTSRRVKSASRVS